jgi:parallel beta-helix repeat protein
MRYIGIIILLVFCLNLLLLMGCAVNTVKPEPANGNLENQEDINQSSNNSQGSSTGPIYEPGTEDTEEPGTVYPQQWATGTGTVGDPWTNSCIESAYTACPTGGTVYLRAGYYVLSTAVQVTKQVNIIGEGRNKTIIITADAFGFNINPADYVTLKGFTIDGAAQTDGAEAGYLSPINIAHSDYILLEDIETKNAGYYGIGLYECNHSLLQNIYAHDNYRHGVCSASDTTGRNMYNTYRDIYAWDNGVEGFDDRGIQAATIPEAHYNVYDNLQCWDNGMHGIALTHQGGIVLSNSVVTGNEVNGIYLHAIEDSTINNCSVILNDDDGLFITNGVKNVNFTNVIVKNNANGIVIYNSSELTFTSCQSYDDRAIPLQYYGIQLEETNSGISLLSCKLTPNKSGDIYNPNNVAVTIITEKMLAKF